MGKITKNSGYNESENILSTLCEKTFLKLWSYPSLFRDDGLESNGVGKELSDLLIVFGSEIVIFSDKLTVFQTENDVNIAWGRWSKRAISDSIKQLIGAKKWIIKHPEKIFLDHDCKKKFPFLEGKDIFNFHLIAIANGLPSTKRIIINTSKAEKLPFEVENNHSNHFIHIFDTEAFKNLTIELDTSSDFINYLNARRETLLNVSDIYCVGEENLLAEYLLREDITSSVFKNKKGKIVSDCEYNELINSHDYKNGKILDKKSYIWDYLIDNLATHIMQGSLITYIDISLDEKKMLIEKMASYDRLLRRELSLNIMNKYASTPPEAMSSFTYVEPDHVFTFIIAPYLPYRIHAKLNHNEYISIRLNILQAYCSAMYLEHGLDVVCIITDNAEQEINQPSETLTKHIFKKGVSTLYRKKGPLMQMEKDNLEYIRKTFGILNPKRIKKFETLSKQYPNQI